MARRTYPMMVRVELDTRELIEARWDSGAITRSETGVTVTRDRRSTFYPWHRVREITTYRSPKAVMRDD